MFTQFISNPANLQVVLVILVVLAGLAIYLVANYGKIGKIVQGLMVQAEKAAGEFALESGAAKFNLVVAQAYPLIPAVFRLFLGFDTFKRYAQKLYNLGVSYFEKGIKQNPPNVPPNVPPKVMTVEPVQPTADVTVTSAETVATGAPGGSATPDPVQTPAQ